MSVNVEVEMLLFGMFVFFIKLFFNIFILLFILDDMCKFVVICVEIRIGCFWMMLVFLLV